MCVAHVYACMHVCTTRRCEGVNTSWPMWEQELSCAHFQGDTTRICRSSHWSQHQFAPSYMAYSLLWFQFPSSLPFPGITSQKWIICLQAHVLGSSVRKPPRLGEVGKQRAIHAFPLPQHLGKPGSLRNRIQWNLRIIIIWKMWILLRIFLSPWLITEPWLFYPWAKAVLIVIKPDFKKHAQVLGCFGFTLKYAGTDFPRLV